MTIPYNGYDASEVLIIAHMNPKKTQLRVDAEARICETARKAVHVQGGRIFYLAHAPAARFSFFSMTFHDTVFALGCVDHHQLLMRRWTRVTCST